MCQDRVGEGIGCFPSCGCLGSYLRTDTRAEESVSVYRCNAPGGICVFNSRPDYANVTQFHPGMGGVGSLSELNQELFRALG